MTCEWRKHFEVCDLPPYIYLVYSGERIPVDKGGSLARKRDAAEEIIGPLRTFEIETGGGLGLANACCK